MTTFALLLLAAFLQSSYDEDMVEAGNHLEYQVVNLELRRTYVSTLVRDLDLVIDTQIKEACNA